MQHCSVGSAIWRAEERVLEDQRCLDFYVDIDTCLSALFPRAIYAVVERVGWRCFHKKFTGEKMQFSMGRWAAENRPNPVVGLGKRPHFLQNCGHWWPRRSRWSMAFLRAFCHGPACIWPGYAMATNGAAKLRRDPVEGLPGRVQDRQSAVRPRKTAT